jgi:hypothetical protein
MSSFLNFRSSAKTDEQEITTPIVTTNIMETTTLIPIKSKRPSVALQLLDRAVLKSLPSVLLRFVFTESLFLGIRLKRGDLESPIIVEVRPDGQAKRVLKVGDVIVEVNEVKTKRMPQIHLVQLLNSRPLRLAISRPGRAMPRDMGTEGNNAEFDSLDVSKDIQKDLVEEFKNDPYKIMTMKELSNVVDGEFPAENYPTPAHLDEAVLKGPENAPVTVKFYPGQLMEYLGLDMDFHLAPCRRISKKAPEDWDFDDPRNAHLEVPWEYYYAVGFYEELDPDVVRAPREGLIRQFGYRPFVWEQWACLKIEEMVRFQLDHERDYQRVNFVREAGRLWVNYLEDPRNAEFKSLYDSKSAIAREKLDHHLMSWFSLLDDISKNEEDFDFAEDGVSLYAYPSALGSGYITSIICLVIQFVVSGLLTYNAIANSSRFRGFIDTDWETFCVSNNSPIPQAMLVVVLLLYLVKVLPDILAEFWNTNGEADTPSSKLNSLRQITWNQGDDSILMQIGYKLEKYMNTLYVAYVMALMLFILFLTDSTLDIILNSLSMEFVHQLDEELSASEFWDPDARYIRAATCEIVIRNVLRLDIIANPYFFCSFFDIPPDEYKAAVGGKMRGLWAPRLSRKDAKKSDFLRPKDNLWRQASKYAKYHGNPSAVTFFEEPIVNFGYFDQCLQFIGLKTSGIFNRYEGYRCWSRWDQVLFLPVVPKPDEILNTKSLASIRIEKYSANFMEEVHSVLNFNVRSGMTFSQRFLKQILDTFLFKTAWFAVKTVWRRGFYIALPFKIIDGFIEWLSYVFVLIIFPMLIPLFLYLIITCY